VRRLGFFCRALCSDEYLFAYLNIIRNVVGIALCRVNLGYCASSPQHGYKRQSPAPQGLQIAPNGLLDTGVSRFLLPKTAPASRHILAAFRMYCIAARND
jgi:hypothetical protein